MATATILHDLYCVKHSDATARVRHSAPEKVPKALDMAATGGSLLVGVRHRFVGLVGAPAS